VPLEELVESLDTIQEISFSRLEIMITSLMLTTSQVFQRSFPLMMEATLLRLLKDIARDKA
jgi:hypothetical protein